MRKTTLVDYQLVAERNGQGPIELIPLSPKMVKAYREVADIRTRTWLENMQFGGTDGEVISRGLADASVWSQVFVGLESQTNKVKDPYDYKYGLTSYVTSLDPGTYTFSTKVDLQMTPEQQEGLLLGWGLASYKFEKYKTKKTPGKVRLIVPSTINREELLRKLHATTIAQDMINEPPNVMTPAQIEKEAREIATLFNARASVIVGDELLAKNFPLIHAVGRGALGDPETDPRLIDIYWAGPEEGFSPKKRRELPLITLVGKGVAFDTGGMDRRQMALCVT